MSKLVGLSLLGLVTIAASCGGRTGLPIPEPVEEDPPPSACEDPEATAIYLVTERSELMRFDPDAGLVSLVGRLDCGGDTRGEPFSMGVARDGTAFVVFEDGELFKVDTSDASCAPTEFDPGQEGFFKFGMGFALEPDHERERLFVAEISFFEASLGLATLDTETLELEYVGPFSENLGRVLELTSSSDGSLHGYFLDDAGQGGWVVKIDKETAAIEDATFIARPHGHDALAFAYWGGDYFIFTSPGRETTVTRFSPSSGLVRDVARIQAGVVGAGVSTCAP
ncbi:MAG: hypothetical protein U0271_07870 [Polyangiaceae bacterium]